MLAKGYVKYMGRFAGHNVVCDLFGLPMLPLRIPSSESSPFREMNEPVTAAQWSDREPYYVPRSAREPLSMCF